MGKSHWPERGWPGGSRAALRRLTAGVRRVLDSKSKSWPNIFKPKLLSFKSLGLDLRISPSLSLPRATHIPPGRPKIAIFFVFASFFSIFSPSKTLFENDIEKTSKKVRKSRFLASQNRPKIHSKCFRKRCPNKHVIFQRFWLEKASVARAPTLDFCWQGHSFVSFSHYSMFRLLYAFSVQKTSQKPFQNEVRTLPKSMSKTCCFLTSIF